MPPALPGLPGPKTPTPSYIPTEIVGPTINMPPSQTTLQVSPSSPSLNVSSGGGIPTELLLMLLLGVGGLGYVAGKKKKKKRKKKK